MCVFFRHVKFLFLKRQGHVNTEFHNSTSVNALYVRVHQMPLTSMDFSVPSLKTF